MNILILQYSTKLSGDVTNSVERHVVDPCVYIQFCDPTRNKPEDITRVKWDVAIIDRNLKLGVWETNKWMRALNANCYRVIQLH